MDSRLKTVSLAGALFLLNVYICHELFGIEYLRHMGSIEGAFIGISRYAMAHWRDLTWFPLWYDGVPYQNTYPPLLHLCVAMVATIRGISPALAYHWTTALAYCLGPVTLFALVLRLTRSRWAAFLAGAFYSTVSISAWLIPGVRIDLGDPLYARRLQALVYYGEGPHVTALTLLPLAILLLDLALDRTGTPGRPRRRALYFVLATIAMAAAVVTNWLGAFAFALMVVAYMIARFESKRWIGDLLWLALMGAAACCLALPWLPPSTIAVTQFNAKFVGGDFTGAYAALPRWGAVTVLSIAALKLLTRRLGVGTQFAILFTLLTGLITLGYEWFHIVIVPQPARYHLEMEMGFALLFGFLAHEMFRNRPGASRTQWIASLAIVVIILAMVQPVRRYRHYARNFLLRTIDITTTSEWKNAQWLNQHLAGERVMLSGSDGFWLTAFSDTPELNGGSDQGRTDVVIPFVLYGVTTGEAMGEHDAEYAVLWLKALGAHAVGVSGPASTEVYKPFRNPKKFEGVLEPLWSDSGDVIYRVGSHASLARVVPRSTIVKRAPFNALDVEEARRYVAALDDPAMPRADFQWTTQHSAHITTELQPGQLISIQIAFHPGWHAAANGSAIPIRSDGLGLMVVDPQTVGRATVDLSYDGGAEMRIAHWLSALSALALILVLARVILKKSW
jgi:hypothetical protein